MYKVLENITQNGLSTFDITLLDLNNPNVKIVQKIDFYSKKLKNELNNFYNNNPNFSKNELKNTKWYKSLKLSLPAIYFDDRTSNSSNGKDGYKNLYHLDLDGLNSEADTILLFDLFKNWKYTRFCYISPSFRGVKVFVNIDFNNNKLLDYLYVNKTHKLIGDEMLEDFKNSNNIFSPNYLYPYITQDNGISAYQCSLLSRFEDNNNGYYVYHNGNSNSYIIDLTDKKIEIYDKALNTKGSSNQTTDNNTKIVNQKFNTSNLTDITKLLKGKKFKKNKIDAFFKKKFYDYIDKKGVVINQNFTFDDNNPFNLKSYEFLFENLTSAAGSKKISYLELYNYVNTLKSFKYKNDLGWFEITIDNSYFFKNNRWFNVYFDNYMAFYNQPVNMKNPYDTEKKLKSYHNIINLTPPKKSSFFSSSSVSSSSTASRFLLDEKKSINKFIKRVYHLNKKLKEKETPYTVKIIAAPGTGKTRFILDRVLDNKKNNIKTIVVIPLRGIIDQNSKFTKDYCFQNNIYDLQVFEGMNNNTPDENYDVYFITPENFQKWNYIYNNLQKKSKVELLIDEWHNIIMSSDYRDSYIKLYDNLDKYKNKIMFSATDPLTVYTSDNFNFKELNILKDKKVKTYQRVLVLKKDYDVLLEKIHSKYDKDYHIFYDFNLKNDKKIRDLKIKYPFLEQVVFLNSGNKDTHVFQNILNKETCNRHIGATKVLSEGININKTSKDNVLFVFFNNRNLYDIEQFTDRYRDKNIEIIDIIKKDNSSIIEEDKILSDKKFNKNYLDVNKIKKTLYNDLTLFEDFYDELTDNYVINTVHKDFLRIKNDTITHNNIGLDYLINESWLLHLKNSKRLEEYLRTRGIELLEDFSFLTDLKEETKEEIYLFQDKKYTKNELLELDNEYKNKLEKIKKNLVNEFEQNRRLKLREEYRSIRNEIKDILEPLTLEQEKKNIINEKYKLEIDSYIEKLNKDIIENIENDPLFENNVYDTSKILTIIQNETELLKDEKSKDNNFYYSIHDPENNKYYQNVFYLFSLYNKFFGFYNDMRKLNNNNNTTIIINKEELLNHLDFLRKIVKKDKVKLFNKKTSTMIEKHITLNLKYSNNDTSSKNLYNTITELIIKNGSIYISNDVNYKDYLIQKDPNVYNNDNVFMYYDFFDLYKVEDFSEKSNYVKNTLKEIKIIIETCFNSSIIRPRIEINGVEKKLSITKIEIKQN